MSEENKILVPNIGDFKDVEVIEVLVKSGQEIKKNDPLITLESDKSSVEVPSTYNGKVKKVTVKIGDKKVEDIHLEIFPNKNTILKVGKRKFLKII